MSSTCEQRNSLDGHISAEDNNEIVRCLEEMVLGGVATDDERLLLGVLLLLPPFADCDGAVEVLDGLLDGPKALEAAIWMAYSYGVLQPDGSRNFESTLKLHSRSAIAHHMLSLIALTDDDRERFLLENRTSRKIRLFPFNILSALDGDDELKDRDRNYLRRVFTDLLVSHNAESDVPVYTTEGLLSRKWDNLISGVRITSQYWEVLATSHRLA